MVQDKKDTMGMTTRLMAAVIAIVVVVAGLVVSPEACADTYNFVFAKPKKKKAKGTKAPVEAPAEEEDDVEAEDPAADEIEVQDVKPGSSVRRTSDDRAIIIHNHNTIQDPSKTSVTAGNANAPVTEGSSVTAAVAIPQNKQSKVRFGLSAVYFPRKEIHDFSSFGSYSYDGNTWSSTSGDSVQKPYGGLFSVGWVPTPYFTGNLFFGSTYVEASSSTMYLLGIDAEVYPFASGNSGDVSPFELAVLMGSSTHLATDGKFLAVHAGARLNINFSNRFGLTGVGRISSDYQMLEAGFITRL